MFNCALINKPMVAVSIVLLQVATPAIAADLGQSGWVTPGSSGGASGSGSTAVVASGALGQSGWMQSGSSGSSGGASGRASASSNVGQSGWITPGAGGAGKAQAACPVGQSDWVQANRAMAASAKSRAQASRQQEFGQSGQIGQSGQVGQSDWVSPGQSELSDLSSAATMTPSRVSEEPMLEGSISQTDIVDDSLAYHGPGSQSGDTVGMHPRNAAPQPAPGPSEMGSMSPMPAREGTPAGGMEEMMGTVMALPMMMAAGMQMMGSTLGGGGFHGYGPGAVRPGTVMRVGPGTAAIGIGSYTLGRMARRAMNSGLRNSAVRIRF